MAETRGRNGKVSYELDLNRVMSFMKEVKPKRVLVEGPPGLYRQVDEVCSLIEGLGIECFKSAMPTFGACLVYEFFPVDAIVHLGHFPYKWWKPRKPTLFLEVPYTRVPEFEIPKEIKGKRVQLLASAQHVHVLEKIKKKLESEGVKAEVGGLVLGCDFTNVRRGFDEYLVVAGGQFHALGVALYLKREVWKVDPYTDKVEKVSPKRILMKRYWKASMASEEDVIAIIDGHEGQSREAIIRGIKMIAGRRKKKVKVYKSLILTKDFILNLPEKVIVIASCPRLAVDDFGEIEEKIVLAPGEVRASLMGLEYYSFPW